MTGINLYVVSLVLWAIWGLTLIIRDWMALCRVRMNEIFLFIIYTLALIFIGSVFAVVGII